ncbi:hypothetical protein G6F42_002803 [Rhizopus arrhizus]|nr:hypothetical protein G6F42_002803 [Rhizopus arrhizus]
MDALQLYNGLIERFNRTLGQILQRRSEDEKKDWDLYLPAALFAYRSIKQATTKQSPFFLTYGYEPKTPFDMKHHLYDRKSPKFEATLYHRTSHQIHNLNRIREQAAAAIKTTQAAQRKAIENKILDQRKELKPPFKLGELVLLYKDYLSTSWSGKLQDKWEGPFIIHQILGKGTYHIKHMDVQDTRIRRVHGNRLKSYTMPNISWRTDHLRNKQENAERAEKGQDPLPEDEVKTLFKLPPEPSRLDSMILNAQMHNFTKQLNQFAGPSLTRLYSIQELQK